MEETTNGETLVMIYPVRLGSNCVIGKKVGSPSEIR